MDYSKSPLIEPTRKRDLNNLIKVKVSIIKCKPQIITLLIKIFMIY